jgi:hypothetical protein
LRIARTVAVPLFGAPLLAACLLAACLLSACKKDSAARRSDPGAQAEPASAPDTTSPTALTLTGPAAFAGAVPVHCVLSDPDGVQINFRTGDADTPAVALRIDGYRGAGPYAARVFVTSRSASGGLVTATGEAHLEMKQEAVPAGAAVLLSGTLDGTYQGEAGKGSIEGRFAACGYSRDRNVLAQAAAGALPATAAGGADSGVDKGAEGGAAEDPAVHESTAHAEVAEMLPVVPPRSAAPAPKAAKRLHGSPRRTVHRRRRR